MNLTFPHDLELLNGFRPLLKELGLVQAVFLVHKLWQEPRPRQAWPVHAR